MKTFFDIVCEKVHVDFRSRSIRITNGINESPVCRNIYGTAAICKIFKKAFGVC